LSPSNTLNFLTFYILFSFCEDTCGYSKCLGK